MPGAQWVQRLQGGNKRASDCLRFRSLLLGHLTSCGTSGLLLCSASEHKMDGYGSGQQLS